MKRFSQRIGASPTATIVQLDAMSSALRHSIWNFIVSLFNEGESGWWSIAELSAQFFFKLPVDELPGYNFRRRDWIKDLFYKLQWYEVYDYVEFVVEWHDRAKNRSVSQRERLRTILNSIFSEEVSGYRFINGELAPISNPEEVAAIEGALAMSSRTGLAGAHAHIKAAIELLAKRPAPDYRNSIKESISAVEAITKQLGTPESQGLSGALAELGKKIPIHGALRSALLSLYGYTSDEGGIRHAMLEEPNVGFDEAKYMVVSCSAFVNFLAAKAQAAGLLSKGR